MTDTSRAVVSTIEVDPFGGETLRMVNGWRQPHRYTTYERDANGGDEAMLRRYEGRWQRFAQPDPYDGSYNLSDPQSLNRYAYVQNDPVSFSDPSGLEMCSAEYGFNQCGGSGGFWGGGFGGQVAEYNRQYAGLSPSIAAAMDTHDRRTANDMGGFGYKTDEEIERGIEATNWVVTIHYDGTLAGALEALQQLANMGPWRLNFQNDPVPARNFGPQGVMTDWNAQMAIGGLIKGLGGLLARGIGALVARQTTATAVEASVPSTVVKDIVAGRLPRSAVSPSELAAAARWYETVPFSRNVNHTFFRAFNEARAYYLRHGGPLPGTAAEFGRRTGLFPLFKAGSRWGN